MPELPQVIGFMSVLEPVFTKPAFITCIRLVMGRRPDIALRATPLIRLGVEEVVKNFLHRLANLARKMGLHFSGVARQNSLQFLTSLVR